MSEYQAKGKEGVNAERPEDKKGEKFNVTAVEGLKVKTESEVVQSCPTLWDPMDCSLLGFSIHGILQARVLEWVAISFSRGSS